MLKAFGAGVILATGFIHMWPDANESFSNSCLGEQYLLIPAQTAGQALLLAWVCLLGAGLLFLRLPCGVLLGQNCSCCLGGLDHMSVPVAAYIRVLLKGVSNQISLMFTGWPDYPYASLIAMVTVICVLALEHMVSRAYHRRLTRQLSRRANNQGIKHCSLKLYLARAYAVRYTNAYTMHEQ